MNILCIIPARSGSKGILNKNIKLFKNKPLLSWSIKQAKESKYNMKIIVSTDSNEYAEISKKYGAEVPFLRDKNFSKDRTTTEATLQNSLLSLEDHYNTKFDICVFLTCTNLFRKISWIKKAVSILKKNDNYDSAFSVNEMYKHFWHKKIIHLKKFPPG